MFIAAGDRCYMKTSAQICE